LPRTNPRPPGATTTSPTPASGGPTASHGLPSSDIILTLEEDIFLEPVTVEPVNSRGNIGLKKKDYEKILALMVVVFSSNNFISFSFIILKQ
jgi:hypothetical protein